MDEHDMSNIHIENNRDGVTMQCFDCYRVGISARGEADDLVALAEERLFAQPCTLLSP